jgi:hypothetical protein
MFGALDSQQCLTAVQFQAQRQSKNDTAGNNLTRDQVTPLAGTIPTVTIGPAVNTAGQGAPSATLSQAAPALNIVQANSFGTIGNPTAPRL